VLHLGTQVVAIPVALKPLRRDYAPDPTATAAEYSRVDKLCIEANRGLAFLMLVGHATNIIKLDPHQIAAE
jgi:hypothetical protein